MLIARILCPKASSFLDRLFMKSQIQCLLPLWQLNGRLECLSQILLTKIENFDKICLWFWNLLLFYNLQFIIRYPKAALAKIFPDIANLGILGLLHNFFSINFQLPRVHLYQFTADFLHLLFPFEFVQSLYWKYSVQFWFLVLSYRYCLTASFDQMIIYYLALFFWWIVCFLSWKRKHNSHLSEQSNGIYWLRLKN